jgi:antirestriction protein ArdC
VVIENQVAYVDRWLRELHDDAKLLIQAAAQAQLAADFIKRTCTTGRCSLEILVLVA